MAETDGFTRRGSSKRIIHESEEAQVCFQEGRWLEMY